MNVLDCAQILSGIMVRSYVFTAQNVLIQLISYITERNRVCTSGSMGSNRKRKV